MQTNKKVFDGKARQTRMRTFKEPSFGVFGTQVGEFARMVASVTFVAVMFAVFGFAAFAAAGTGVGYVFVAAAAMVAVTAAPFAVVKAVVSVYERREG